MATSARASDPKWHGFVYSSASACGAVLVTNPLDVAKTRLQLQGELSKTPSVKVYSGPVDAILKIGRAEGVRGLQRGLSTALVREATLNFFRLGLFAPILHRMHPEGGNAPLYKKIAAGLTSGSIGALCCNPLDLLKTRTQAYTTNASAVVGHQHDVSGSVVSSLVKIVQREGVLGLWKGTGPSMLRLALGSAGQLSAYTEVRCSSVICLPLMCLPTRCDQNSPSVSPTPTPTSADQRNPHGARGRRLSGAAHRLLHRELCGGCDAHEPD